MPFSELFFWAVPIVALTSYCILMLCLSLSKKDKFIRIFMLVLAALILWTMSSLFMAIELYPGVLFWDRVMVVGMIAVPYLLYYFISVFTNSLNPLSMVLWGVLTAAAFILNLLGLVVIDASVITTTVTENGKQYNSIEYYYVLGKMAIPMYVFTSILISSIILKARHSVREGKTTYGRVGPIIAGISLLFIGSLLNVIHAVGKYPVDILLCFINAILIMYAIYKHRMLELRLLVTKGIVYSLFAVLITCVYVYTVFFVEKQLGNSYQNITPYFITLSALLVAVVFQPLYRVTCILVDKMFYKAEYSQRQALKNFSVSISNKLDLQDMASELIEAVQLAIHAREIILMLKHEDKGHYYVFSTSSQIFMPDFEVSFDNPIVKWLKDNINPSLSRDELYSHPFFKSMWEKEKKVISDLDIEVIIPIKSRSDLIGMLMLTRKNNSTAYTLDDLDLLTYLGTSSAVAFDNARLFSRAQSEALTDSLTKLFNHRYFHKALSEQTKKIGSAELSLLMLDLDLFKLYNDLYGHSEGDKALQVVAAIMTRLVGQKGIVCRYGGEEFAILLPYYDSKRAYDMAENIRLEIQRTFFNTTDVTQRFLTASIGVCTYPHAAVNAEELLKRVDLAMYTAKNNGKNQTVIYTPNFSSSGNLFNDDDPVTIEPAYTATIYALTAAIDAKDHYTFGHSQRVAEYATVLAGALGLDKSHLDIVRQAALLHDVGKIGIPENILAKTGRLTVEEYAIVKKHVELSITIIKHLPSMNHVIPAVIGHHERWDGRGYPRGLRGENIPLLARCLAVTDAFDALTSNRPYKASLSVISALNEIESHAGTQFDPAIAHLFIKLVREGAIDVEMNQKINQGHFSA